MPNQDPFPQEAPASAVECALELVLLLHDAGTWTLHRSLAWSNRVYTIALATGTDLAAEATTKALCDAVRAALSSQ